MKQNTSCHVFLYNLLFLLLASKIFMTISVTGQRTPILIKVGMVVAMDENGESMGLTCINMALSDFYATHSYYKTRLALTVRDSQGDAVQAAAADKNRCSCINSFILVVYEDNVFGEGIVPLLSSALEKVNARVPYRSVLPSPASDDHILAELYRLQSMHTRVFIVHVLNPLGSRLFTKAKELGMMSGDYIWIITDGMTYELNTLDPLVLQSMLGVVGVRPYVPKTEELDNFKIQYKMRVQENNPKVLSPEVNIFGLWAYDTAVALAMAVENASITSDLRFIEANISSNSTDLESIGTSVAGPMLVRALLSTSFKGLSGIFNFVDGQLQSPPYEIINVVGPGDQVIGYWTKENGIIRDLNFTGAKENEYSTNKSNLGSTIWPGDRTSPGKGWVIPINDKKLRVGVPVKEGFSEFVKVTWNSDNSVTVGGHCIQIFDEVMKSLPYGVPYEYVPFATSDHKMAGKYDDLVHQVYLGEFDAVAGDVTILANRSHDVDFTLPYMESGVTMVVPFVHDKRKNGWIFLKPLTRELWLMILGSFLAMGLLIWNLERHTNEDFQGTHWYQFVTIFWFTFSTMVFAHREKIVTNPAKFVLMIWFFVVLVLTQSYTAGLASMLTIQRLQPAVTDIDFLLQNKLDVGFKNGSFVYDFLIRRKKFDVERLVAFNSPEEMDQLFRKGSGNGGIAAAFHEIPYIKLFLAKYCPNYTTVNPVYMADGFGFVFPKGSPLVPDVSRAILNYTEGTTMSDFEDSWLRKNKCPDPGSFNSEENSSLQFASFKYLFIITATAGLISLFWDVFKQCRGGEDAAPVEPESLRKIKELLELVKSMETTLSTNIRPLNRPQSNVGVFDIELVQTEK